MSDESLAKVLADLAKEIGEDRVSTLRREAVRRGVTIQTLLAEAVVDFSERMAKTAA